MQLFFNLSFGYPSLQKYPQPSKFTKQEKEKFRSFLRCYLITTNTKPNKKERTLPWHTLSQIPTK